MKKKFIVGPTPTKKKKFIVSPVEAVQEIVDSGGRARNAMEYLRDVKDEVNSDYVELGDGTEISRIVMGMGDMSPMVLLRRQFIMEWTINGGVHPTQGEMTPGQVASQFGTDLKTVNRDVTFIKKKMGEAFSTPEACQKLVMALLGESVAQKYADRRTAMRHLTGVERVLRELERYFDKEGWVLEGNVRKPEKFNLPEHLKKETNVKSITFNDARELYFKLAKLRNDTFDRVTGTGDALTGIAKILSAKLGSGNRGENDGGGIFLNVENFNQLNAGGGSRGATLDDIRGIVSSTSILPMGLDEESLEKEARLAMRNAEESDERVAKPR